MTRTRFASAVLAALCLGLSPAISGELPSPEDDIVLRVTGQITQTNANGAAEFDMAMLQGMPVEKIETTTTWTEGVQTFTGVPLAALLEAVGASGSAVKATAVNDYAVEIPSEDWEKGGPIIAYLHNGSTMSLRGKGPLWIIYPFDSDPAFQSELIYARSIWQLDRIEVLK
ncbi:oxidoreductase [Poseidonocella sp. HB161398]|uniref:oxidoreductase n=1 Tax=Poseidonocella sp. HB161398 TaxID=2320855 RepID=UPI0011099A60|nr:oxidoreductase [Poseidonocella sp. HB161398]